MRVKEPSSGERHKLTACFYSLRCILKDEKYLIAFLTQIQCVLTINQCSMGDKNNVRMVSDSGRGRKGPEKPTKRRFLLGGSEGGGS